MRYTESSTGFSKEPPRVGQAASVWSEVGHVVAVDENLYIDDNGKRYIRYHVKPTRPDWPVGTIPVRRYVDERK